VNFVFKQVPYAMKSWANDQAKIKLISNKSVALPASLIIDGDESIFMTEKEEISKMLDIFIWPII
jgi:hypothetical protein